MLSLLLEISRFFRGPYSTFLEVIHQAATSKLDIMVSLAIIKGKFSTEKHQLPLDGMTFIIQRPRLALGSLTRSFMLSYNIGCSLDYFHVSGNDLILITRKAIEFVSYCGLIRQYH